MDLTSWLFALIMFPLLFVTVVSFYVAIFTRDNPETAELSDKAHGIGSLTVFTLILLAFLRAIIG